MQFTARSLADLLRSLRSNKVEALDKRKSPRVGMRVKTDIWHESLGQLTVWVRDLSAGGANLAVSQPMRAGDSLHLLLAPGGPGDDEKIECHVMHCRKLATNMYSVGVKFTKTPTTED